MKKVLLLLLLLFVVGCEEAVVQEISWVEYEDDNGFSIDKPDWNGTSESDDNLFTVNGMGCMAAVNKYNGNSEMMFDWLNLYLGEQGVTVFSSDEAERSFSYSAFVGMFLFNTELKIFDCNGYAYNAIWSCEQSVFNESVYSKFFDSFSCEEKEIEVDYFMYNEDDFYVTLPEWSEVENEGAYVLNDAFCNVYVFENQAGYDEVYGWLYDSLENPVAIGNVLEYTQDNGDNVLKSKAGFNYCNYKTYIVSYTCVDSMFIEAVADEIVNSLYCDAVYEEEEIEEVELVEEEEVVEEVEEIEEEVVSLVLPEEYGFVDAGWIVWFINSNDFFTFILEDYDKVNLVLEDDVNFNIKADLVNGEIVHIEEGLHSDGVSVYIPADTAVEILNNAENINFVNFLVFAAQVRTEPESLKQDVINKVLGLS
ncbi:hypothetical protein HOE07_04260 [archaeon]|nr:hypothetical protein [archaeon]